jgi:antirestriction protein
MANTTRPRVYVACLASYNAGTGHGLWIAVSDADTMHDAIGEVLSTSLEPGAEEWAIHDYDGFPSAIADSLGEHPDLEAVVLHAGMLVEHGDAWTAYVDWKGLSVTPSEDDFEEAYLGVYDNPGDYAEEHLTDTDSLSGLAEGLRVYFDFEAFERDMCLSGDIYRSDDGHVFLNL